MLSRLVQPTLLKLYHDIFIPRLNPDMIRWKALKTIVYLGDICLGENDVWKALNWKYPKKLQAGLFRFFFLMGYYSNQNFIKPLSTPNRELAWLRKGFLVLGQYSRLFPYLSLFTSFCPSTEETPQGFNGSEEHLGTTNGLYRGRDWAWLLPCIHRLASSQQISFRKTFKMGKKRKGCCILKRNKEKSNSGAYFENFINITFTIRRNGYIGESIQ